MKVRLERRDRIRLGWVKLPLTVLGFAVFMAGCGGGGGGGTSTPSVSVNAATVARPLSGTVTAEFRVVLSGAADGTVTADYATADGTAIAGTDYTQASGTVTFTPGQTSQTVSVTVNALSSLQPAGANQTFTLSLSNVSANAALGTASATGTIVNRQLNDTGVQVCANSSSTGLSCPRPNFYKQDGDTGRDALAAKSALTKVTPGARAGFDFTMLNATGQPTTSNPRCIRDNVTGLWWEVKTASGLQAASNTYTWYNPDNATNGGNMGSAGNGTTCSGSLSSCNTDAYVNAVNNLNGGAGLCGKTGWRLPTVAELRGIADLSKTSSPYLSTTYFPNTPSTATAHPIPYWTGTPSTDTSYAWEVLFGPGTISTSAGATIIVDSAFDAGYLKSKPIYVRLVRTGP